MIELFKGVFEEKGKLLTLNLVPGKKVYEEDLFRIGGKEYRSWNPYRSKLGAAIKKGLKTMPIGPGAKVLYLGAATGTTVSHVSDIIGEKGEVYAVEISAHSMKTLIQLCEVRRNIIPILADAGKPDEYAEVRNVNVVFEDVAHPEQAEMMNKNARFLKKGGYAMIAIKSQSIDVTKKPEEIYAKVEKELAGTFEIVERISLEPYEMGHLFLLLRRK
ncbi:MAG: fibrillarin-like rRNA/tRNA 2'-O-methyltransferase [Candidatus Micrarchaeota archaeon]